MKKQLLQSSLKGNKLFLIEIDERVFLIPKHHLQNFKYVLKHVKFSKIVLN